MQLLYTIIMESIEKQIISDIPIYYINLDRSEDRNKLINKQFDKYNITNVTRIQAIDGKELNMNNICKEYKLHKNLNKYTTACTLSHIKAVKKAYEDGCDLALIMEDDCNFDYLKYKNQTIKELVLTNPKYNIFQLGYCTSKISCLKSNNIVTTGHQWGTICYVVTREGMENIIKLSNIYVADVSIYECNNVCYTNKPYFTYHFTYNVLTTIHLGETHNNLPNNCKKIIDTFYEKISKKS
jgi:GR25 family glycosyltransferase involved in LPS biosynthesis